MSPQFNPYGGGLTPTTPSIYSVWHAAARDVVPLSGSTRSSDATPSSWPPAPSGRSFNYGSKIFLPPSALEKVSRLHVQWPIMLEMINGEKERHTHGGVLEFVAEEGRAYLPQWVCLRRAWQRQPGP